MAPACAVCYPEILFRKKAYPSVNVVEIKGPLFIIIILFYQLLKLNWLLQRLIYSEIMGLLNMHEHK